MFDVIENEKLYSDKKLNVTGMTTYYCMLGKDYTILEYEIELVLDKHIMEFDTFGHWINHFGDYRGTREKAMLEIYNTVDEKLKPKSIRVTSKNLNRHPTYELEY